MIKGNDLTVAICLYNAEKYITETLSCIVNQTYQNFNLLIINDCCTDNSVYLVEQFFQKYPRQYKLINFDENKGIGYARHFAERYAKTKYMMFVDSDDCPHPELVEKEYNVIESDPDLMAVSSRSEYIDCNGCKLNGGLYIGATTKEKFMYKAANNKLIFLPIQAIYNRKLALLVGGFNVEGFPDGKPRYQDFCEDLDLWTRMSDLYKDNKAIIVIPEVLYKYRKCGGLSSNTFNMSVKMRYVKSNLLRRRYGEQDRTFIEFYNSLSLDEISSFKKNARAADCLRNGVFYLRRGNLWQGIKNITISVWLRPKYIWQKIKNSSEIFK
jgi:glycosyltransferase involved in cell wall biosynthesis